MRNIIERCGLYFFTIKDLKLSQIIYRIINPIRRTCQPRNYVNLTHKNEDLIRVDWLVKEYSLFKLENNNLFFDLVNREIYLPKEENFWNLETFSKLWIYNLNYFDFIIKKPNSLSNSDVNFILEKWIKDNQYRKTISWDPYPLSLRVINWIKWIYQGNYISENVRNNLYHQGIYLLKNLEFHLRGNHLLANAKALIFLGCFFESKNGNPFLKKGKTILVSQIMEQVNKDGSHFEKSPMYHNIILEDLLDIKNIDATIKKILTEKESEILDCAIKKMLIYMNKIIHPDGDIPFFNDSTFSISSFPKKLNEYAEKIYKEKITYEYSDEKIRSFFHNDSGLFSIKQDDSFFLIADLGDVGPKFIPGHAHAGSLSFELSIKNKRIIVNSGVSDYSIGKIREYERSTRAHSTVEVDGKNSSEVWSSFRVGKKARVFNRFISEKNKIFKVEASHDGYKNCFKNVIHKRCWIISENKIVIKDFVFGKHNTAIARFIIHPDCIVSKINDFFYEIRSEDALINLRIKTGNSELVSANFSYEFGKVKKTSAIEVCLLNGNSAIEINW